MMKKYGFKRVCIAVVLVALGFAVWFIATDRGDASLVYESRHTFQAVVIDPTPYITNPETFDASRAIFVRKYDQHFGVSSVIAVDFWPGGRFFFPGVPGVDLVELYRPQGRAVDAEGNSISLADIPIGATVEIEFDGLIITKYPSGASADLIRVVG